MSASAFLSPEKTDGRWFLSPDRLPLNEKFFDSNHITTHPDIGAATGAGAPGIGGAEETRSDSLAHWRQNAGLDSLGCASY
jgi:hypothetical protein